MNKVRELKVDSTLWATPARIINLLDFNPEKLTIDKELNSIHNTADASSKDLINIHQVRYENGGFYLTIDNIKGYFKLDDNIGGILDMILTDDQKNKYYQVWKEVFKIRIELIFLKVLILKNLKKHLENIVYLNSIIS